MKKHIGVDKRKDAFFDMLSRVLTTNSIGIKIYSYKMAPWSSGQDTGLSRL